MGGSSNYNSRDTHPESTLIEGKRKVKYRILGALTFNDEDSATKLEEE